MFSPCLSACFYAFSASCRDSCKSSCNDEWSEIYDIALDEREILEKYLELPNGIPSHDTIQRLFSILNGDDLQSMLVNILANLVTVAGKKLDKYLYRNEELECCIRDVIAADGKEILNTGNAGSQNTEEQKNLQEFNVLSTEWGINLSSTRINEKSNKIPEMQKVMKTLDCRGCVVTADAMNTQKATAQAIIEDAYGDYCLALKGNLKTAYQEVKEYFSCEEHMREVQKKEGRYKKETEETSIEAITREYYITDDIKSNNEGQSHLSPFIRSCVVTIHGVGE